MAVAADGRSIKLEDSSSSSTVATSSKTSKRRSKPRRSFSSWLLNNLARVAIWYSLVTIILRCPSKTSDLSDANPQICKPYLSAKTHIQPYIEPYYDNYAKSYVDAAKPYTEQAYTRVIKPASVIATRNYQKYAAPQIDKAKDYAFTQWDKTVMPQVQQAQEQAYKLYDSNLAPHVEKASSVAGPYYEAARDNALDVHQKHIVPAISYSMPHLQTAYLVTQKFLIETGIPFVQHAWSNIIIFVDGTLWPFVRAIYRDNVKPQLVMISERIAKYQESRILQSAIDEVDNPQDQSTFNEAFEPSVTATETVTATEASTTATISLESVESSSPPAASETPVVANDETVAEDLSKWQKKFGIAAEKGTEDLSERIEEIITGILKGSISEGEGLANALEKTAEVELDKVRSTIKAEIRSLPEDAASSDGETAEEEVMKVIREGGQKVKGRARNIRTWADQVKKDLQERTTLATDSTLQVLDGIRDLGLQEVGMRWASMEGITYKHWEKYHDLKKTFEDWRTKVKDVAVKHPFVEQAYESAQRILEESMGLTEDTAKELIRLKDVAKWKIRARDDTDDFESQSMPAAVVSAASSFVADVEDTASTLLGGSQGSFDSFTSDASINVFDAASSVSSYVAGSTGSGESILSEASSSADEALLSASSFILGTSTGSLEALSSSLDSAASAATETAADVLSSLKSAATIGPSDEGVLSSASDFIKSATASASSVISDATETSHVENVQSIIDAATEKASEAASSLTAGV